MKQFKIVVVGDISVGKTAIIKRYVEGRYEAKTKSTVGVDFYKKIIRRPTGEYNLQVWDTAGQERFTSVTTTFFRGAHGAILVYDLQQPSTRQDLTRWRGELDAKTRFPNTEAEKIPVVLLANKCDLGTISDEELGELKEQFRLCGAYRSSAKDGIGITTAFEILVDTIERMLGQHPPKSEEVVPVNLAQPLNEDSGGCCSGSKS